MKIVKPIGILVDPMSAPGCGCTCSEQYEVSGTFQQDYSGGCLCQCGCKGASTVDNYNANTSRGQSHAQ